MAWLADHSDQQCAGARGAGFVDLVWKSWAKHVLQSFCSSVSELGGFVAVGEFKDRGLMALDNLGHHYVCLVE